MTVLIYLHGFLSSPESTKAIQVKDWLTHNRPDIDYLCPALSSYPKQAIATLDQLMRERQAGKLMLMGSSLGGYWATWLAEQYDVPAVLINPLVHPSVLKEKYVGVPLRNYHTREAYLLTDEDMHALSSVEVEKIADDSRFWLMVQTEDESLDYRFAVKKYKGSRQLVEEGGNHSFENFSDWIPSAIEFLEAKVR